jgi:hypothetical protein
LLDNKAEARKIIGHCQADSRCVGSGTDPPGDLTGPSNELTPPPTIISPHLFPLPFFTIELPVKNNHKLVGLATSAYNSSYTSTLAAAA